MLSLESEIVRLSKDGVAEGECDAADDIDHEFGLEALFVITRSNPWVGPLASFV